MLSSLAALDRVDELLIPLVGLDVGDDEEGMNHAWDPKAQRKDQADQKATRALEENRQRRQQDAKQVNQFSPPSWTPSLIPLGEER